MTVLPFQSRPIISVVELASIAHTTSTVVKRLCAAYSIPVTVDPTEGEMLSLVGVHSFLSHLHGYRSPDRFDRIMLLLWLCGLDAGITRNPPAYNIRLDNEIKRIRRLHPDDRVIRALELLERFVDAEEIVKSLQQVALGDAADVKARARSLAKVSKSLRGICSLSGDDSL